MSLFWIMITWVYSRQTWFSKQWISTMTDITPWPPTTSCFSWNHGRRGYLRPGEKSRGHMKWSHNYEVEKQHASICAACFQMPVSVHCRWWGRIRNSPWCYDLIRSSRLSKLSDAQSRWWHIQGVIYVFIPPQAKKEPEHMQEMGKVWYNRKMLSNFHHGCVFTMKIKTINWWLRLRAIKAQNKYCPLQRKSTLKWMSCLSKSDTPRV